jgi:hypothetical protein
MAELADAADSKSSDTSPTPIGEVPFFLCFPAHPNSGRNQSVLFGEVFEWCCFGLAVTVWLQSIQASAVVDIFEAIQQPPHQHG